jgi:hypothetical protein
MSGWRKRTIMEMALEAGFEGCAELTWENVICTEELERFAALVREDERDKWMDRAHIMILGEREACAKVCEDSFEEAGGNLAQAIRARGQA